MRTNGLKSRSEGVSVILGGVDRSMKPFTMTEKDIVAVQVLDRSGHILRYHLIPFLSCLAGVVAAGFLISGKISFSVPLGIAIVAYSIITYGVVPKEIKRRARQLIAQNERNQHPILAEFDPEGIQWKDIQEVVNIRWDDISTVKEDPMLFLLYQRSGILHILPKRAFSSEEERRRFADALETRSTQGIPQ